jgi:hypothetical protein
MSALKKTCSSKAMMMLKADHQPNFNPLIMLILLNRDSESGPLTVDIMILKDLRKKVMKDNTKKKALQPLRLSLVEVLPQLSC